MKLFVLIMGLLVCVYAEKFAVVVGIDNYKNPFSMGGLEGAVNDAEVFNSFLLSNGFRQENVLLLLNKNATKKGIQSALLTIESRLKKGRGDRFYYFHAGHGAKLNIMRSKLERVGQTALLIPYDFLESDSSSYILTERDLMPIFKKIDKKITFGMLTFDSCYSENAYRGGKSRYRKRGFNQPLEINVTKYNTAQDDIYPYKNIISLSASGLNQRSEEDEVLKRGKFSMAMEYCLQEQIETTDNSLKKCLNRKYTKTLYRFKAPNTRSSSSILFRLQTNPMRQFKVLVQTDMDRAKLSSLADIATFVSIKQSSNDLELKKESRGYKLTTFPSGDVINIFKDMNSLKQYLSNYRLMYLQGKQGSDVDIKVSYPNAQNVDNDKVPLNSNLDMKISSNHNGKIALFSLNMNGKLFMIEPTSSYHDFYKTISIKGETTSLEGTDFLKAMIFENRNGLVNIEVNNSTGEVESNQINTILNIVNSNSFYGSTRRVAISGRVQ